MAEYDNNDFKSEKKIHAMQMQTKAADAQHRIWEGPAFPMDESAKYTYYSRMGGFVPTEAAIDTVFSNPAHYGAGGFEGIRLYRTPFGDGFVELPHNIARFIYSSLAFNLSLVRDTMKLLDDPAVDHVEHLQRTPKEFFEDAVRSIADDHEVRMGVDVFYKDGRKMRSTIPFLLKVRFDGIERVFSMKEMEAAICSLAFLNDLVRGSPYPGEMRLIEGGYFRPVFWVSGEEGLKVPTLIKKDGKLIDKPLYFAIGTLPWGTYLSEEGYKTGLDVLIAPYRRIDDAMPVRQKIAGNYVNSARNINLAMMQGFGEILSLNHEDRIVEGSAENLVFLFTHETGKMMAFLPPLSSNILAGTTRNRILRVLEEGLVVEGKKVELVLEAPKKDFVLNCLQKKGGGWDLSAIVLMGTGVGLIHARSLTVNPALRDWMEVNELRSEEMPENPIVLRRPDETKSTYLINGGERHAFVNGLQDAYGRLVMGEQGKLITPPYMMDWIAAERIFGISMDEVHGGKEFRKKAEAGYFKEKMNGLSQPNELDMKYCEALSMVKKMCGASLEKRVGKNEPLRLIKN